MEIIKTVFYGTPGIAVPFLERLHRKTSLLAVVTRADQPAGRGLERTPSPVKRRALELKVPVFEPKKSSEIAPILESLRPDLAVVVAYGKILPKAALEAPRLGSLNVHFSLLPKYRGAAPIQWALIRGEAQTGVSIFWLDEGMDTGPLFLQKPLKIEPEDDCSSLAEKLVRVGLEAMEESLDGIEKGEMPRIPQEGEPSTAAKLTPEDGSLSFELSSQDFFNRVRGLSPRPGAHVPWGGKRLKVLKSAPGPQGDSGAGSPEPAPGTVLLIEREGGILVKCRTGSVWILEVHPESKKPLRAFDFANGCRLKIGDVLR